MNYSLHPACCIFPERSADEIDALANDIKSNGQRFPIILYEDKILDGRSRLAACERAGVEPRFVKWSGEGSPIEWYLSTNLLFRRLTSGQRAWVAYRATPFLKREIEARQPKSEKRGDEDGFASVEAEATEIAARAARVPTRDVEIVKLVATEHQELLRGLRSGEISVLRAGRRAGIS